MLGISWLAEKLLAYQERLSSVELVDVGNVPLLPSTDRVVTPLKATNQTLHEAEKHTEPIDV
jgi:hypothetical protein